MGNSDLEPYAMPSEHPVTLSIPEACDRIGVGETTLRAMMSDGRLPFSRIVGATGSRGRVIIKVADVDALLDSTRVQS
jgi:excisionase family DNA binding protein